MQASNVFIHFLEHLYILLSTVRLRNQRRNAFKQIPFSVVNSLVFWRLILSCALANTIIVVYAMISLLISLLPIVISLEVQMVNARQFLAI